MYTLKGKIARTQPYALDKSLTLEGAAAEAQATGAAIKRVQLEAREHALSKGNPHRVTKADVGLGNVDNTSDLDKPVSYLQAEAIADAKNEGFKAQEAVQDALREVDDVRSLATEAGDLAANVHIEAGEARGVADEALATAKTKAVFSTKSFKLYYIDWAENTQTVNVEGVTAEKDVFVAPAPDSYKVYTENGVVCTGQGDGTLTFTCATVPDDLTVNLAIWEVVA